MRYICSILTIVLTLALTLASCLKDTPYDNDRPGNIGGTTADPTPDYTEALSNSSLRFESDTLTVCYNDGGVMYTVDGSIHRFIDLESGRVIVADVDAPSLTVGNRKVSVTECRLIGEKNGLRWYAIQPEGQIIVVEIP